MTRRLETENGKRKTENDQPYIGGGISNSDEPPFLAIYPNEAGKKKWKRHVDL